MNMKKDKLYARYKKHTSELCQFLRTELFCGEYLMDIEYSKEEKKSGESFVAGEIKIDTKYINFTVTFYPEHFRGYQAKNRHKFLATIVHEMCHLLTEPLYLLAIDGVTNRTLSYLEEVRERQTERIANAVFALIPEKLKKI